MYHFIKKENHEQTSIVSKTLAYYLQKVYQNEIFHMFIIQIVYQHLHLILHIM